MLYIMRHGITDWNKIHRLQGRTDIPLNEEGRQMAKGAAIQCKDVHFDICYCSPLSRAKETANLVLAGRNIPIITDNRLVEMCFGKFEGIAQIFDHPDLPIYKLFKEPENFIATDGVESLSELFARTGDFLRTVIQKDLDNNKDILIVGHGAMNHSIICQIKNLPLSRFWETGLKNCALIKLI